MGSFRKINLKLTMEQLIAIIYCRVSSRRQVTEGHGLDSQEQKCTTYAINKGYKVVKVFRDEGISGALKDRPAMKELLKYLENNLISKHVIIVDDLSRLARDVQVHIALSMTIRTLGSALECVNQVLEDSPQGEFFELMTAGYSQMDRKINAKRVKQRMQARLEMGYWCFCPPTGMKYKKTSEHGKLLFPKEPIASIIKEAIEGFVSGKFVAQVDVQNYLQSKQEMLKKETVGLEFVKRILTEITYTGYLEYPQWDVPRRKAHHKGFISIATYNAVQEKLKKPEKKLHTTDTVEFPLRRLVACSECGKQMTGSRNKGKLKYYTNYTCNNRECSAKPKNIQKHILEKAYVELLKHIAPQKEILDLTKAIASDSWTDVLEKQKSNKLLINNKMAAKKTEINSLLDLLPKASNEIVRQYYESKIEELTNEIEELNATSQTQPKIKFDDALEEVLDFIGTPHKYWKKADIEGKHMIHRLMFTEKPTYNKQDGFGTPKVSLPFQLNSQFESKDKCLVEMPRVELGCKGLKCKRLQS